MKQRAFTLIEVMIVVVLIAVIAGFGIPQFTKSLEKGRARRARVNLMAIHAACEMYYANSSPVAYPPDAANLSAINAALQLNLLDLDFNYSLDNTGAAYTATAARSDGSYSYQVSNAPLSSTNPSCSTGTCPL